MNVYKFNAQTIIGENINFLKIGLVLYNLKFIGMLLLVAT